jgi:hypothetical protein
VCRLGQTNDYNIDGFKCRLGQTNDYNIDGFKCRLGQTNDYTIDGFKCVGWINPTTITLVFAVVPQTRQH